MTVRGGVCCVGGDRSRDNFFKTQPKSEKNFENLTDFGYNKILDFILGIMYNIRKEGLYRFDILAEDGAYEGWASSEEKMKEKVRTQKPGMDFEVFWYGPSKSYPGRISPTGKGIY